MSTISDLRIGPLRGEAALAWAAIVALVVSAGAQNAALAAEVTAGRIKFDYPGKARATVEVDLDREMFASFFSIGEGAITGAVEALNEAPEGQPGSDAVREAAARAAGAKELIAIAKDVVNDVHVRIYDGIQRDSEESGDIIEHYNKQLDENGWDNVVRVSEGAKGVRVSIARGNDSIQGLFISVFEGDELVLVNLTCDISPENAQRLANAAVKSGLQAGLGPALEKAMKEMK
jgi:hypothetical protein